MKKTNDKSQNKSKDKPNVDRRDFIKKSMSATGLTIVGSSALLSNLQADTADDSTLEAIDAKVGDFGMWSSDDLSVITDNAKNLRKEHLFKMFSLAADMDGEATNQSTLGAVNSLGDSYFSTGDLPSGLTVDDLSSLLLAMDQHAARNTDGYSSLLAGGLAKSSGAVGTAVSCCCSCTPCCCCATNVVKPVPSSSV